MPFTIYVKGVITVPTYKKITNLFQSSGLTVMEIRSDGEILLSEGPTEATFPELKDKLSELGHPVIEDNRGAIVSKVKRLLENLSFGEGQQTKTRMSDFLAARTTYEYHYLSSLFSQIEGITIEGFFIQLKVNRIKEQIEQGTLTLSEISYKYGYSSPAHLTNQFKKVMGMTPSQYRSNFKKK